MLIILLSYLQYCIFFFGFYN